MGKSAASLNHSLDLLYQIQDAIINRSPNCIPLLTQYLKNNGNLSYQDDTLTTGLLNGGTLLTFSCEHMALETVRWLIQHGADVNIRSHRSSLSPLSTICSSREISSLSPLILQLLLESGADIILPSANGYTPLIHLLCSSIPFNDHHVAMLKHLLQYHSYHRQEKNYSSLLYNNIQIITTPVYTDSYYPMRATDIAGNTVFGCDNVSPFVFVFQNVHQLKTISPSYKRIVELLHAYDPTLISAPISLSQTTSSSSSSSSSVTSNGAATPTGITKSQRGRQSPHFHSRPSGSLDTPAQPGQSMFWGGTSSSPPQTPAFDGVNGAETSTSSANSSDNSQHKPHAAHDNGGGAGGQTDQGPSPNQSPPHFVPSSFLFRERVPSIELLKYLASSPYSLTFTFVSPLQVNNLHLLAGTSRHFTPNTYEIYKYLIQKCHNDPFLRCKDEFNAFELLILTNNHHEVLPKPNSSLLSKFHVHSPVLTSIASPDSPVIKPNPSHTPPEDYTFGKLPSITIQPNHSPYGHPYTTEREEFQKVLHYLLDQRPDKIKYPHLVPSKASATRSLVYSYTQDSIQPLLVTLIGKHTAVSLFEYIIRKILKTSSSSSSVNSGVDISEFAPKQSQATCSSSLNLDTHRSLNRQSNVSNRVPLPFSKTIYHYLFALYEGPIDNLLYMTALLFHVDREGIWFNPCPSLITMLASNPSRTHQDIAMVIYYLFPRLQMSPFNHIVKKKHDELHKQLVMSLSDKKRRYPSKYNPKHKSRVDELDTIAPRPGTPSARRMGFKGRDTTDDSSEADGTDSDGRRDIDPTARRPSTSQLLTSTSQPSHIPTSFVSEILKSYTRHEQTSHQQPYGYGSNQTGDITTPSLQQPNHYLTNSSAALMVHHSSPTDAILHTPSQQCGSPLYPLFDVARHTLAEIDILLEYLDRATLYADQFTKMFTAGIYVNPLERYLLVIDRCCGYYSIQYRVLIEYLTWDCARRMYSSCALLQSDQLLVVNKTPNNMWTSHIYRRSRLTKDGFDDSLSYLDAMQQLLVKYPAPAPVDPAFITKKSPHEGSISSPTGKDQKGKERKPLPVYSYDDLVYYIKLFIDSKSNSYEGTLRTIAAAFLLNAPLEWSSLIPVGLAAGNDPHRINLYEWTRTKLGLPLSASLHSSYHYRSHDYFLVNHSVDCVIYISFNHHVMPTEHTADQSVEPHHQGSLSPISPMALSLNSGGPVSPYFLSSRKSSLSSTRSKKERDAATVLNTDPNPMDMFIIPSIDLATDCLDADDMTSDANRLSQNGSNAPRTSFASRGPPPIPIFPSSRISDQSSTTSSGQSQTRRPPPPPPPRTSGKGLLVPPSYDNQNYSGPGNESSSSIGNDLDNGQEQDFTRSSSSAIFRSRSQSLGALHQAGQPPTMAPFATPTIDPIQLHPHHSDHIPPIDPTMAPGQAPPATNPTALSSSSGVELTDASNDVDLLKLPPPLAPSVSLDNLPYPPPPPQTRTPFQLVFHPLISKDSTNRRKIKPSTQEVAHTVIAPASQVDNPSADSPSDDTTSSPLSVTPIVSFAGSHAILPLPASESASPTVQHSSISTGTGAHSTTPSTPIKLSSGHTVPLTHDLSQTTSAGLTPPEHSRQQSAPPLFSYQRGMLSPHDHQKNVHAARPPPTPPLHHNNTFFSSYHTLPIPKMTTQPDSPRSTHSRSSNRSISHHSVRCYIPSYFALDSYHANAGGTLIQTATHHFLFDQPIPYNWLYQVLLTFPQDKLQELFNYLINVASKPTPIERIFSGGSQLSLQLQPAVPLLPSNPLLAATQSLYDDFPYGGINFGSATGVVLFTYLLYQFQPKSFELTYDKNSISDENPIFLFLSGITSLIFKRSRPSLDYYHLQMYLVYQRFLRSLVGLQHASRVELPVLSQFVSQSLCFDEHTYTLLKLALETVLIPLVKIHLPPQKSSTSDMPPLLLDQHGSEASSHAGAGLSPFPVELHRSDSDVPANQPINPIATIPTTPSSPPSVSVSPGSHGVRSRRSSIEQQPGKGGSSSSHRNHHGRPATGSTSTSRRSSVGNRGDKQHHQRRYSLSLSESKNEDGDEEDDSGCDGSDRSNYDRKSMAQPQADIPFSITSFKMSFKKNATSHNMQQTIQSQQLYIRTQTQSSAAMVTTSGGLRSSKTSTSSGSNNTHGRRSGGVDSGRHYSRSLLHSRDSGKLALESPSSKSISEDDVLGLSLHLSSSNLHDLSSNAQPSVTGGASASTPSLKMNRNRSHTGSYHRGSGILPPLRVSTQSLKNPLHSLALQHPLFAALRASSNLPVLTQGYVNVVKLLLEHFVSIDIFVSAPGVVDQILAFFHLCVSFNQYTIQVAQLLIQYMPFDLSASIFILLHRAYPTARSSHHYKLLSVLVSQWPKLSVLKATLVGLISQVEKSIIITPSCHELFATIFSHIAYGSTPHQHVEPLSYEYNHYFNILYHLGLPTSSFYNETYSSYATLASVPLSALQALFKAAAVPRALVSRAPPTALPLVLRQFGAVIQMIYSSSASSPANVKASPSVLHRFSRLSLSSLDGIVERPRRFIFQLFGATRCLRRSNIRLISAQDAPNIEQFANLRRQQQEDLICDYERKVGGPFALKGVKGATPPPSPMPFLIDLSSYDKLWPLLFTKCNPTVTELQVLINQWQLPVASVNKYRQNILTHALVHSWSIECIFYLLTLFDYRFISTSMDYHGLTSIDYIKLYCLHHYSSRAEQYISEPLRVHSTLTTQSKAFQSFAYHRGGGGSDRSSSMGHPFGTSGADHDNHNGLQFSASSNDLFHQLQLPTLLPSLSSASSSPTTSIPMTASSSPSPQQRTRGLSTGSTLSSKTLSSASSLLNQRTLLHSISQRDLIRSYQFRNFDRSQIVWSQQQDSIMKKPSSSATTSNAVVGTSSSAPPTDKKKSLFRRLFSQRE